jgi:hypothetical protein
MQVSTTARLELHRDRLWLKSRSSPAMITILHQVEPSGGSVTEDVDCLSLLEFSKVPKK